jgi:two-component sensor histidine kinase
MKVMGGLIWLIILIGSLAFAIGSYYANEQDESEQADRLALQLTGRLTDQLTVLEGVRALFEIAAPDDDRLIREYLHGLQKQTRDSGFQGIGIALATVREDRAETEARITRNYGQAVSIWPFSDSDLSYPIVLIEPFNAQNRAALGYDMYSEAIRRRALQRAWTTGRASASGVLHLVQDDASGLSEPGFLILMPVRSDGQSKGRAPTSRRSGDPEKLMPAFIYAPIRIKDMINTTLGPQLPGISGIEVYAGTGPSAPRVYHRGSLGWSPQRTEIRVADSVWTIVISYDRIFSRYIRPIIVGLLGLTLSLMVMQLSRTQRRRVRAFQKLAEQKARHAEDRELILGEMVHRLKNAFARVGALARITVRESSSLAEFEQNFEGRLRALADTKQMMVFGTMESLDLCRLIRRELDLAGCTAEMCSAVSGPMVHLNDEGAQSIALVVHELVTNSIKYGALSCNGNINVKWRTAGDMVHLEWVETGLPSTPELKERSFGSHFIQTLIQRTLQGEWQRIAEDRQLTVLIRWKESQNATTSVP